MARQNQNEFRPDQVGKSLLSRLYPTKLQRQAIKKWLFYALVLLVVSVLQDVVMRRLRLFGATTDLVQPNKQTKQSPQGPASALPGIYPEELNAPMFTTALFKQSEVEIHPSVHQLINS